MIISPRTKNVGAILIQKVNALGCGVVATRWHSMPDVRGSSHDKGITES